MRGATKRQRGNPKIAAAKIQQDVYLDRHANFALISTWLIWFYTTYVYSGNILKNSFKYTTEQIISHNLAVFMISMLNAMLLTYLSYKINPLKILKIRLIIFAVIILPCPYLLNNL